jgi:2-polyprenyl-6-methoxyphenol hydroxylase-like FAD-dependent oxidoreductase
VCFHAVQRQGHTPLHKAAWGGHIALCRWLRDECGAVDDVQDLGGNYAADEADMGGHVELAAWLRDECSGARARSCTILGLAPNTTDLAVIRGAYLELSRKLHPDRVAATGPPARAREVRPSDGAGAVAGEAREKQNGSAAGGSRETKKEFTAVEGGPQCTDFIFVAACEKEGNCGANCGAWRADETRKDFRAGDTGVHSYDFTAVAAAYDHLTRLGGRGSQANPTHSLRRMLQATGGSDGEMEMGARTGEKGLGACAEKSRPDGVSVAVEPDEETEMGARTGEKAAGPSPMAGGLVPGTCAGEGRADAVGAGESSGQDGGGTSACPNWESADNSLQSRQRQDACVSRDALSQRAKGRSGDDAFQQKVKGGCADSIQQRAKGGSGDAFSLGEKDRSGDAFFQQKESLDACVKEARSIFKAKLAAVAHEYSCSGGLPLSKLRGKYEQVWRGEQLPSPAELGLAPRTKLVDMLRSFSDTVIVEKAVIAGGQPLIHPIVSREEALGIGVRLAGRDEGSGEKDADRNTVTVEEGVVVGGQPLVRPIVSREEALGIEVGVAPTMDVRQGEESGAKDGAGLAERGAAERGAAGRTEESGGAQVHSPSLIVGRDASPVMSTGGGIGGFTAAHPQMPDLPSMPNEDHLPVVIIGGGIGGLAAAVALQSRGVPCVVYERDSGWDHKRRGYGLTLSNARALAALGIEAEVRETNAYCPSDAHWVFDQAGKVLGYFGVGLNGTRHELRGNLRVPRQVLRRLLVARLRPGTVRWGWKMLRYTEKVGAVTATLERVAMPGRAGRTGGGVIPEGAETPDGAAMHGEKIPEGAKVPAGAEMWGGGAIRGKAAMPRGAEVAAPAFAIEAAVPLGGVVDVRGCLLLGADGVRSAVRSQKHRDTPRYVGVVLFLGESRIQHPLLHEQGFYTVDGLHRIFTMPLEPLAGRGAGAGEGAAAMKVGEGADLSTPAHSTMWQLSLALPSEEAATLKKGEGAAGPAAVAAGAGTARPAALKAGATPAHSTMWQLSFALPSEEAAVALCSGGGKALLREALRRCSAWHSPVPEMLAATDPATVWGTPLVDCAPLPRRSRDREIGPAAWTSRVVLMGDAAHPMTPFKGQGANMTLADAPLLAQCVADSLGAGVPPGRRSDGPRLFAALARFEREMMDRAQVEKGKGVFV